MTSTILQSDLSRLEAAFADLNEKGIKARANFWCCGGCAVAALDQEKDTKGFVYWHEQDDERAFGIGTETYDCGSCCGSGSDLCDDCHGEGVDDEGDQCVACGGTGEVYCDSCGGNGTYEEEEGRQSDDLQDDLYLGFGHRDESKSVAIGVEVVKALVEYGLDVEWDGDPGRRILVKKN